MADFEKIKSAAEGYSKDMNAFLRAIVKNPGESCDEKAHIDTIAAEMKKVGFDDVQIDPQGNVINAKIYDSLSASDQCLRDFAIRAARLSKFSKSATAPSRQQGEIVYRFIAQ